MGTAAAAAGTALVMNAAEAADEIDKLSLRTGIGAEELQRWKYAAIQTDADIGKLEVGIKKMSTTIEGALRGNKLAVESFEELGISAKELESMTLEQTFERVMYALADMEEGAVRNKIGNDMLGKSYTELLPLIAGGAGEMSALRARADELGVVMSQEAVTAAVTFGDTLTDIQVSLQGAANNMAGTLMPVLQKFADLIVDKLPVIHNIMEKLGPVVMVLFESLLPPVLDLVNEILPLLLDLFSAIMPIVGDIITMFLPPLIELMKTLLPPVIQIVQMILPLLLSLIKPILPLLQPILELLSPFIDLLVMILEPLTELLNLILPPLIDLITKLIEFVLPPLNALFKTIADTIGKRVKTAFDGIKSVIDSVKKVFTDVISFIDRNFVQRWNSIWTGVKNFFGNIWESIKNIFKAPINWIIDGINKFIRGLNKLKIPDWVPLVGGKGINIKEIPRLKVGLDYVPFDDFPALLHKGERVLTAEEAEEYPRGGTVYNIYLNNMPASDTDKRKLAQYIEEERRRGLQAKGAIA